MVAENFDDENCDAEDWFRILLAFFKGKREYISICFRREAQTSDATVPCRVRRPGNLIGMG